MNATIIPLQQLYLGALVALVNSDKLEAVQQDIAPDTGRLWLVREGSTVPHAQIAYKFELDSVTFAVITRDERNLGRTVKYAEGLDGFLEDLQRFMQANRLTSKKHVTRLGREAA